jgi:RNA polymerase sigma-70 factor, ECF subfamily
VDGVLDGAQQDLLARYAAAFERYDVDALVALLHEDATMSMPPLGWWLRGRAQIHQALLGSGLPCKGSRLVPVEANGSSAFAQYTPTGPGGALVPWALVVVDVADGRIAGWTSFLDAARLFPLFGLPLEPMP